MWPAKMYKLRGITHQVAECRRDTGRRCRGHRRLPNRSGRGCAGPAGAAAGAIKLFDIMLQAEPDMSKACKAKSQQTW